MAKKATDETSGSSAVRSNGYDPEAVKRFASRVENLEGEIDVFRTEFKERCEPIKEDIKGVIDEAETAGIPKKEFKKVLKRRATERKLEADRLKLNQWEQERYDNLRLALGDIASTPLGQAALGKAPSGAEART